MSSDHLLKCDSKPGHVLVTGGAGFIGSHTVDLLLEHGCRVTIIDNLSTGSRANLAHCEDRSDVLFMDVDVTSEIEAACTQAVKRFGPIDRIAHFAAQTSVPLSVNDPIKDIHVNIAGTARLLEYARRHDVQKLVFASSAAVYGDSDILPLSETSLPRPNSPYGIDKLAAEQFLDYYARNYGIAFTALRIMNAYGPRQDPSSSYSGAISIFMERAVAGRPITIFGDGEQTRDFVYVSDVSQAVVTAALSDAGTCSVINIGSGTEVTINYIARAILDLAGSTSTVRHELMRAGDIHRSVATTDRARNALGFAPHIGLREGLARTLAWVRDRGVADAHRDYPA